MRLKRRNFLFRFGQLAFAYPFLFLQACSKAARRSPEPNPVDPSSKNDKPAKSKFRLAFGSCAVQDLPQPIWKTILGKVPDVFVFLGDNIYADTEDASEMRAKYEKLAKIPEFAEFRKRTSIIATWDDHDYGVNDGGVEYPMKEESKKIMLDFFHEPELSKRRSRAGIYTSYFYGTSPHRVQMILLDLRWFRSKLKLNEKDEYVPQDDESLTLLGAEQWQWLEEQLKLPADVRILASSIQLVATDHRWEKWANFPHEKRRLFRLLDELQVKNLVVISGDMHYAELSLDHTPQGTPVYDLTSSGLNIFESASDIPNAKRQALYDTGSTFGFVDVEFGSDLNVALEVYGHEGTAVIQHQLRLNN